MAFLFWGKKKNKADQSESKPNEAVEETLSKDGAFSDPIIEETASTPDVGASESKEIDLKQQDSTIEVASSAKLESAEGFDLSGANDGQKEAIQSTDGPVLITAGPGTGKTFTLVQRALYLILKKGVKPEQILMATFTEKAAKELITRISNELAAHNIPVNINEMYIGTFHSICLRIIKEHLEYTRVKKNFRTLDDFDQKYTVFQNIRLFQTIKDFSAAVSSNYAWDQAKEICTYVNNLTEELVDVDKLIISGHAA